MLLAAAMVAAMPLLVQAQPQTPLATGVVVSQLKYDEVTRAVTLTFLNTGAQEVTAFEWSLKTAGTASRALLHQETVDLLPLLALRQEGVGFPRLPKPPSFQPGETYTLRWSPPQEVSITPDGLTASVSMAIYSDCTAIGDPVEIGRVFRERRVDADDDTELISAARSVPRDSEGEGRLKALAQKYDALVRADTGGRIQGQAKMMKQLVQIQQQYGWSVVDKMLRVYEERATAMSKQSRRKEK